jgi:hypothetical protein
MLFDHENLYMVSREKKEDIPAFHYGSDSELGDQCGDHHSTQNPFSERLWGIGVASLMCS